MFAKWNPGLAEMLSDSWNTFIPAMFQNGSQAPLVPYGQGSRGTNVDEVVPWYFSPQNRLLFVAQREAALVAFPCGIAFAFCPQIPNIYYPS